jgi:uncharacterized protein
VPRLIIVPRWSGDGESDFYPWLRDALASRSALRLTEIVTAELLPVKGAPTIEACVSHLEPWLLSSPEETFVLAHSVGCQAALRALARHHAHGGQPIAGALLVAGWFSVDEPWPTILPWMETPADWGAAGKAARRIHVLLSDDDPFTADHVESRRLFETRVAATVTCVPGAKHFNAPEQPAVLEALIRLVGAAQTA